MLFSISSMLSFFEDEPDFIIDMVNPPSFLLVRARHFRFQLGWSITASNPKQNRTFGFPSFGSTHSVFKVRSCLSCNLGHLDSRLTKTENVISYNILYRLLTIFMIDYNTRHVNGISVLFQKLKR